MVIVHMDQDGSKNGDIPSSKLTSALNRAWKTSFHYKLVIFRVYVNLPEGTPNSTALSSLPSWIHPQITCFCSGLAGDGSQQLRGFGTEMMVGSCNDWFLSTKTGSLTNRNGDS